MGIRVKLMFISNTKIRYYDFLNTLKGKLLSIKIKMYTHKYIFMLILTHTYGKINYIKKTRKKISEYF